MFSSRRVSALRGGFSWEVEALHETVELGRADVSAYHRALIDKYIRLHRPVCALVAGVVFYAVGPTLCAFARIGRQVEILRLLNLVVFLVPSVELGGNYNLGDFNGVLLYLPAELRQKRREPWPLLQLRS